MKVNFYLREEKAGVSSVQIVVTHHGQRFRRQTGMSVRTDRWKRPKNGIQTSTDPKVAGLLKEMRLALEWEVDETTPAAEVENALDRMLNEKRGEALKSKGRGIPVKKKAGVSFAEYFKEYSERERPHVKNYTLIYRRVMEMMGDGYDWEDIDGAWYFRLMREMERRGYSLNYQGTFVKMIKAVMNEAYTLKLHRNDDFRMFRKPHEPADSVYLTQEEVDAIWELDLSLSEERKARDLFIVGVYTAARFSDYSRLTERDVQGGFVRFVQKKTAGSVVIPASPRLLEVLRRNGGRVPKLSPQKFNETIKKVCMKAGITEPVKRTRSVGARHITETLRKCDMVTSHTARRTGATLLYMSGVPLKQCMLITGHTTEENFMRYIRVSNEENAEKLASNPFFTRE